MQYCRKIISSIEKILELEYHQLSLWYFVSFAAGIVVFFNYKFTQHYYYFLPFLIVGFFYSALRAKSRILVYFILSCLIAFVIGFLVSNLRFSCVSTNPIDSTRIAQVQGKITRIKPTLHGMQITLEDLSQPTDIKKLRINISSKLSKEMQKGDIIALKAKLYPLSSSVLPGTFDFGFYMYMDAIEATGYALSRVNIISGKRSVFQIFVNNIRQRIYSRLLRVLDKDNGNFLSAVLIGETKAIPLDIADNMRNSGVAHILSVSGLHLSLVAMITFIFSRFLLNISNYVAYNFNIKILSAIISLVSSFVYLQISGGNIAATRAFIMTSIFILSIILGRSVYPIRSVMLAGMCILCFMPEYILHPSFQLSFIAVLCLVSGFEFYIHNQHRLGFNSGSFFSMLKFYICSNIYSSLIASVATAPYVIYHFYKFANYSILMNLVAVPVMSFFIMPLALLCLILMPLGLDAPILYITSYFTKFVIICAEKVVSLPGSVWYIGHISSASLLLFSFGFLWLSLWQTKIRLWGIVVIFIAFCLIFTQPKAQLIYDNNLKLLGVQSKKGELRMYSKSSVPKFTSDYWASWYGQKDISIKKYKRFYKDRVYKLNNGKKINFAYKKCKKNVHITIITSKNLKCNNVDNKIYNGYSEGQIILY